ncbi:MAG: isoprenylcysteine carboxylmethyltransferase family protein, partial [Candidatus Omnitrophica bacterium]|nr:isoprenylcysteine carboxylmethyltransferase family protein [Candidatus Omnitrophota bacterium]
IDSSLLFLLIFFTGFLYLNKHLYAESRGTDNVLDFLGMVVVLKGVLLRMSARGHKKTHSQQGRRMVTTGPYTLVRTAMSLGSCMIGCGLLRIVWPCWNLPVFALFFYLRFNKQIIEEEKYLGRLFGDEFAEYCRRTPRLLPSLPGVLKARPKEIFNIREAFGTKDKWGLLAWPLLAVVLEFIQESFVFGSADWGTMLGIFVSSAAVLAAGLGIAYRYG